MQQLTEKEYRQKIYQIFEHDLLGHNDNQRMQKQACLVIEGMRKGQSVANNNISTNGSYTYKEVYYSTIYSKQAILKAFKTKSFNNETNKVRYACAIIRNNINTISMNLQNAEIAEKDLEHYAPTEHDTAEYTKKTQNTNEDLEGLW